MSLTLIPLEPPAPPAERNPDQGDLFDAHTWESAYQQMHDFPTLLIQAQDDLSRARKREAFWVSLFAHAVLLFVILHPPDFLKFLRTRPVMPVQTARNHEKLTFLDAPPDAQKAVKRPQTDKISDKNRVAMSRTPQLDRQQLKKLLDASRAGNPRPASPPAQQQAPQQSVAQSAQPQAAQESQPSPPPSQMAKLQTPPVTQKPSFSTGEMSAGRAIEQAARAAAATRGTYPGDSGDFGLNQRQPTAHMGPMEILSDTQGVDFGPYLQRVLHDVKQNWYGLIPESAMAPLLKRGKVSIEFAITKNGQIAGLRYVNGSGDVALDRAAYGGITSSNPFPPLPSEFGGPYLGLRFTFFYNPDTNETDLR